MNGAGGPTTSEARGDLSRPERARPAASVPHAHWSSVHPADGPCNGCDKDVVYVAVYQYVEFPEAGPMALPKIDRTWR